jgi:hypothetical protein
LQNIKAHRLNRKPTHGSTTQGKPLPQSFRSTVISSQSFHKRHSFGHEGFVVLRRPLFPKCSKPGVVFFGAGSIHIPVLLVSFFTDIHVPGETTTETVPDGDNCKTTTKEAVLKTTTAATCHPKHTCLLTRCRWCNFCRRPCTVGRTTCAQNVRAKNATTHTLKTTRTVSRTKTKANGISTIQLH